MDNPYKNQYKEIASLPEALNKEAAGRLMPPQYDEFVKSFNQPSSVSQATRIYWYSVAIAWGEAMYDDGQMSEQDFYQRVMPLAKQAEQPEAKLVEIKTLPAAINQAAFGRLNPAQYNEFVKTFNQPDQLDKVKRGIWRKAAFNIGDALFLEGRISMDEWTFRVLPLMEAID